MSEIEANIGSTPPPSDSVVPDSLITQEPLTYTRADGTIEHAASRAEAILRCPFLNSLQPDQAAFLLDLSALGKGLGDKTLADVAKDVFSENLADSSPRNEVKKNEKKNEKEALAVESVIEEDALIDDNSDFAIESMTAEPKAFQETIAKGDKLQDPIEVDNKKADTDTFLALDFAPQLSKASKVIVAERDEYSSEGGSPVTAIDHVVKAEVPAPKTIHLEPRIDENPHVKMPEASGAQKIIKTATIEEIDEVTEDNIKQSDVGQTPFYDSGPQVHVESKEVKAATAKPESTRNDLEENEFFKNTVEPAEDVFEAKKKAQEEIIDRPLPFEPVSAAEIPQKESRSPFRAKKTQKKVQQNVLPLTLRSKAKEKSDVKVLETRVDTDSEEKLNVTNSKPFKQVCEGIYDALTAGEGSLHRDALALLALDLIAASKKKGIEDEDDKAAESEKALLRLLLFVGIEEPLNLINADVEENDEVSDFVSQLYGFVHSLENGPNVFFENGDETERTKLARAYAELCILQQSENEANPEEAKTVDNVVRSEDMTNQTEENPIPAPVPLELNQKNQKETQEDFVEKAFSGISVVTIATELVSHVEASLVDDAIFELTEFIEDSLILKKTDKAKVTSEIVENAAKLLLLAEFEEPYEEIVKFAKQYSATEFIRAIYEIVEIYQQKKKTKESTLWSISQETHYKPSLEVVIPSRAIEVIFMPAA